ncbi:MAG: GNAT family N-acetyltransferase [Bacteroidia bacterium]|nr:GNAT family N-acetyltransferase [Bacteroidia bacterium]
MLTARTQLRLISWDDFDEYHQLSADPEVMKYISPVFTPEQSRKKLAELIEWQERHPGRGYWTVRSREDGRFVGVFCLRKLDRTEETEIGYRISRDFWGKGFASEVAEFLVGYARDTLRLERIVAVTDPHNLASQRVLEKVGLQYLEDRYHYGAKLRYFFRNFTELPS